MHLFLFPWDFLLQRTEGQALGEALIHLFRREIPDKGYFPSYLMFMEIPPLFPRLHRL